MRVLVIEDDPDIAKAVKAMLQRARRSYDTAIVDVALQKRDGFAICRSARSQGISTPILILHGAGCGRGRCSGAGLRHRRLSDQAV